jgi:hypothetical protein
MIDTLAHADGAFHISEFGLEINRKLTREEWREAVGTLQTVKHAYVSALADLTRHGREHFGDEFVAETFEQLQFDLADVTKADAVSHIPLLIRSEFFLTSEHAYVLAMKFPEDEKSQKKWAALVKEHDLDAFELKRSIESDRLLRHSDLQESAGHGAGIPTVQGVRFQFDKWQRSLGDTTSLLKQPPEEKRKILETLQPIIELAAEIEGSL